MTERRLTTEDLATHREAAEHDGAIVPQGREPHDATRYDDATRHDDVTRHDTTSRHDTTAEYDGVARHDTTGWEPGDRTDDHDGTRDRELHDGGADDREPVEQDPPVATDEPVEPSAVSLTAGDTPLFATEDSANYQAEWRALQADFVDDPREAVQRADELVAQVMQNLATTFAEHKRSLEDQWHEGGQADTEELRQALKRYRSFFDRLLSV